VERKIRKFCVLGVAPTSTFRNYTHSEPRFRALLTEGGVQFR
jgi:hypothetical protein